MNRNIKTRLLKIARAGAGISAALFIILFASGCRYTAAPTDLLQQPAIAADKMKLVTAINKTLSKYSKLSLPLRQEKEEAIRLIDVDGDGRDEAIVTYHNEYSTPQLLVFKEQNNAWKAWLLIEHPLAKQLEWLYIKDLDGDGFVELLVGWVSSFDSPNMLEIYSFEHKGVRNEKGELVLQPVDTLMYSYADIGDIGGEGSETLAVVTEIGANVEIADKEYELELYDWTSGGLRKLTGVSLENGVNGYSRLVLGRISPRHYGLILEASAGAHSMYTTMYKWENRKLKLVYPTKPNGEEGWSISSTRSQDVNGDGILELHQLKEPPGYGELPYSETLYINQWLQWDGRDSYTLISEDYSDYLYGIQISFPESLRDKYTLHKADDTPHGLFAIEYWSEATQQAVPVLTLHAVPQPNWDKAEAELREQGYVYEVVLKDGGNIYAMSFNPDPLPKLSTEELAQYNEMLKIMVHFSELISPIELY